MGPYKALSAVFFAIFIGLVFLETNVYGWGEYTHAGFGTLHLLSLLEKVSESFPMDSSLLLRQQRQVPLEAVFVTANAFPDAFKFTRDWMHSLEYAAFQVEAAARWSLNNTVNTLQQRQEQRTSLLWTSSYDFLQTDAMKAFSYGYLLHLIEDYVGHHDHSYLNPQKDHLLEFDVDTLFYQMHKSDAAPWYYKDDGIAIMLERNATLLDQIATFISKTSSDYAKIDNITSGLTKKQILVNLHRFLTVVKMEKAGLILNKRTYRHGMVAYDVCHAKTFNQANGTLQRAIAWTEECIQMLEKSLFPYTIDSEQYARNKVHNDKHKTRNTVLAASRKAVSWIDKRFQRNGGTICNTVY